MATVETDSTSSNEGFKHSFRDLARDLVNKAFTNGLSQSEFDGLPIYTTRIMRGVLKGQSFSVNHPALWRYAMGLYEREVTAQMEKNVGRGSRVVDVGGHVGYMAMYARALVGQGGTVDTIEPSEANLEVLKRNVIYNGLSNIHVVGAAVSDREGTAQLALHESSYENYLTEERSASSVSVPVTSLDHYIDTHPSNSDQSIDFIKVDVEGHEFQALSGARLTFYEYQPIVVAEVRNAGRDQVESLMRSLGYKARMISSQKSNHYKVGTPNVLFTPARY